MTALASFSPVSSGFVAAAAALLRGVVKPVRRIAEALEHRREVAMLLNAEPGMLRDIGLTQTDVVAALSEPMWRDPSSRLLVWTTERRAAWRAQVRENLAGLAPKAAARRRERV